MASQRPAHTTLHLSDEYGDVDVDISVGRDGITAEVAGSAVTLGSVSLDDSTLILSNAGQDTAYAVQRDGDLVRIARNGMAIGARIGLKIDLPRAPGSSDGAATSSTRLCTAWWRRSYVAVGDERRKGSAAVVQMEAMKLIHTLTAPVSGPHRGYSLQRRAIPCRPVLYWLK